MKNRIILIVLSCVLILSMVCNGIFMLHGKNIFNGNPPRENNNVIRGHDINIKKGEIEDPLWLERYVDMLKRRLYESEGKDKLQPGFPSKINVTYEMAVQIGTIVIEQVYKNYLNREFDYANEIMSAEYYDGVWRVFNYVENKNVYGSEDDVFVINNPFIDEEGNLKENLINNIVISVFIHEKTGEILFIHPGLDQYFN